MAPFGAMFLLMSLAMQGANDMLDYVDTPAYWKSQGVEMTVENLSAELVMKGPQDISALVKQLGDADFETREAAQKKIAAMGPSVRDQVEKAAKSDDPEVAARAKAILDGFARKAEGKEVRVLMAIKGLGELKDKTAIPALTTLLASKEPFVAEYAAEAIATIQGKPYRRPMPTDKELEADLALLPANCALVGQIRITGGGKPDFAKAFDMIPKELKEGMDKDAMIAQASQMVAQAAGYVGNVRAGAITVGVADQVGPRDGFVVAVGRGIYYPDLIRGLIKEEMRGGPQTIAGVDVWRPDDEVAMILPSANRFIFIAGEDRMRPIPYEPVAKALAGKEKGVTAHEEMAKLLGSVDRTKTAWAVARITPSYHELPFLVPFDTVTMEADEKDDALNFKLIAKGKDAEAIKTAVAQFDAMRKDILREMKEELDDENDPDAMMIKPFVGLFESVKIDNAGKTVTVTAQLKGGHSIFMMLPAMLLGRSAGQAVPMEGGMDRRRDIERMREAEMRMELQRRAMEAQQRAVEAKAAAEAKAAD